jgi:hypothetical protein
MATTGTNKKAVAADGGEVELGETGTKAADGGEVELGETGTKAADVPAVAGEGMASWRDLWMHADQTDKMMLIAGSLGAFGAGLG